MKSLSLRRSIAVVVVGAVVAGLMSASGAGAGTRGSQLVVKDVSYGEAPAHRLDVYRPAVDAKRYPAVVLVHGGGWHQGSKSDLTTPARRLAGSGFVVFNVDYRLAGATTAGHPTQVNDILKALLWVSRNGARYSADPGRVALVGGSAGGHLAALAGQRANEIAPGAVEAVATLSAPTNLLALGIAARAAPARAQQLGAWRLANYLGCEPKDCTASQAWSASPVAHVRAGTCPAFFIAHSNGEPLPVSQARELAARAKLHGCRSQLHVVGGNAHGFAYFPEIEKSLLAFLGDSLS